MKEFLLDNYIKNLETDDKKIIGVYRQGSHATGDADEFSDTDYVVIWKADHVSCEIRRDILQDIQVTLDFCIDNEYKGTDRFLFNKEDHNIVHRLGTNFFAIYDEIHTKMINDPKLYILGGFTRGEIIYDPEGKLQEYKEKCIVTPELIKTFNEIRLVTLKSEMKALRIAGKRQQPVEFVRRLDKILVTLTVKHYLDNNMFPVSPKWLLDDAKRFSWHSELISVVKELRKHLPFDYSVLHLEKELPQE